MASLHAYYQNVRGLRSTTHEFYRNVAINNYDLISLTETWLLDGIFDAELFDDRYCVWRRDRDLNRTKQSRGGGVLIAVSKNIVAVDKPEWRSLAEDVWVSLTLSCPRSKRYIKLNICTVYLCKENMGASFSDHVINFCNTLESLISPNPNDKFLIIGDFNMSSIFWSNTHTGLEACGVKGEHVQYLLKL
ncbi:unnamed protein product [Parnassius apollo]|uniref:(apollo) hypothetical protein n=1 Tax=Parnassius apollo TaxID=110799 RepID=A0A8S3Y6Y1_PARAO|nr:unnamed protein product [Parnassius apollo]